MEKYKVKKTIWKEEIEEIEIKFPYYAWDTNKKECMIKLDVVRYENLPNKPIKWIKKIELMKGFSFNSKIIIGHITTAGENIISEDIVRIIKDFDIMSNEEEFNNFRQSIIDETN